VGEASEGKMDLCATYLTSSVVNSDGYHLCFIQDFARKKWSRQGSNSEIYGFMEWIRFLLFLFD